MAHKDTEIAKMIMRKNDDSRQCYLPVVVVRCGRDELWKAHEIITAIHAIHLAPVAGRTEFLLQFSGVD